MAYLLQILVVVISLHIKLGANKQIMQLALYTMIGPKQKCFFHNLSLPDPSYKFLFTTPETITTSNVKCLMQTMTANNTLTQFVIDEAHCIDCWAFHFRPSYSSLGLLKDYGVPVVALTATATDRTVSVINLQLRLETPAIITQSFLRRNLHFSVVPKKSSAKDDIAKLISETLLTLVVSFTVWNGKIPLKWPIP